MADLADIQSQRPCVAMPINMVGVRNLPFSLSLADREQARQRVAAKADLGVALAGDRRGAHMSRLVEILNNWHDELNLASVRALLSSMQERLQSDRAWARFAFAYLMAKKAPVSARSAMMAYNCSVAAKLVKNKLSFQLSVQVPVMTVCPCSLAISSQGAHCQRAIAAIKASINHFIWLEEFIELAEKAGSAPVYPLLKREDEKCVTETAFANPAFVEDVARAIAFGLDANPCVDAYEVEVESMESIHQHNAFARIQKSGNAANNTD